MFLGQNEGIEVGCEFVLAQLVINLFRNRIKPKLDLATTNIQSAGHIVIVG